MSQLMRMRVGVGFTVAIASTGLTMCAKGNGTAMTTIRVAHDAPGVSRRAGVVEGGSQYELPDSYCYAVHVTAPASTGFPMQSTGGGGTCKDGSPDVPGLGLFQGTYAKGESASFDVLVGAQRRFDLIGIPKAMLGNVCAKDLRVTLNGSTNGDNFDIFLGGSKLDSSVKKQIVFFATATQNIVPGNNDVVLQHVSGNLPTGVSLPFGSHYGCSGDNNSGGGSTDGGGDNSGGGTAAVPLPLWGDKIRLSFRQRSPSTGPERAWSVMGDATNRLRGMVSFGRTSEFVGASDPVAYMFEVGPGGTTDYQAFRRDQVQSNFSVSGGCSGGTSTHTCRVTSSPLIWGGFGAGDTLFGFFKTEGATPEYRWGGSILSGITWGPTFESASGNDWAPLVEPDTISNSGNGNNTRFASVMYLNGPGAQLRLLKESSGVSSSYVTDVSSSTRAPIVGLAIDYPPSGQNAYFSTVASEASSYGITLATCQTGSSIGQCEYASPTVLTEQITSFSKTGYKLNGTHIVARSSEKIVSVYGRTSGTVYPLAKFYRLNPSPSANNVKTAATPAVSDLGSLSPDWTNGEVHFVRGNTKAMVAGGYSKETVGGTVTYYPVVAYWNESGTPHWEVLYKGDAGHAFFDGYVYATPTGPSDPCYNYVLLAEGVTNDGVTPVAGDGNLRIISKRVSLNSTTNNCSF